LGDDVQIAGARYRAYESADSVAGAVAGAVAAAGPVP